MSDIKDKIDNVFSLEEAWKSMFEKEKVIDVAKDDADTNSDLKQTTEDAND